MQRDGQVMIPPDVKLGAKMNKAYLVLENEMIFEGYYFGMNGEVTGEIVFTTGMSGYEETLTDPSFYGQIVLQTFPLIGNYGIISPDFESSTIWPAAYIVKYPCSTPSNFRSEKNLDEFLKEHKITGICGIDTRAVTKVIRESGVMNGKVMGHLPSQADFDNIKSYKVGNPVNKVSSSEIKLYKSTKSKYKVALYDFGIKENIKRELCNRECDVWVFPHNSSFEDILNVSPDGIMLSNGPGNPKDNVGIIDNIRVLTTKNIPIFGICLGHQLLALANNFRTSKLKYGHRGANQPVKDIKSKRVYITSQNHGYVVDSESIDSKIAYEWFVNVNDKTCEGIMYKNANAFSVQFHPEACPGPHDTNFLFDYFIESMEAKKYATK